MLADGRSRRTLLLLSLAGLGWAVSFNLGAQLAALWLRDAGHSASAIGLNTGCYYVGVAVASPLVPWLMRRSSRACVVAGMLLDALTTALFPWCAGLPAWHALRLLGGVGTALSLIPMETLVNHNAPAERRARDFGVYAFCVALGIGLGQALGLPLYPIAPRLAFALGGLVTLLAVGLAWPAVPADSGPDAAEPTDAPFAWRDGAFGLGTAWAQGFLEGGTIAFLSLYLLSLGFGAAAVSGLGSALFAGVVVAQLPLAWLADRLGRLRVLLLCHGLVLTGLGVVPWLREPLPLSAWLFVLGACCGALYPLGLSLLGERLDTSSLARANAWYLASNCAGSLSGPVLIGLAIDACGLPAQFAAAAAAVVLVLLVGFASARMSRVPSPRDRPCPGSSTLPTAMPSTTSCGNGLTWPAGTSAGPG